MLNRGKMIKRGEWFVAAGVLVGVLSGCGGGEAMTVPPDHDVEPTAPPVNVEPPDGPQAAVKDVINEVDAHPLDGGDWEAAVPDMVIYTGGEVWAQEASTARLEVGDVRGLVRVAPNTIFTLEQPEPDTVELDLDEGQIWLNVEGLEEGQIFQVETDAAMTMVRGTRFSVDANPDGTTTVSSQEGDVVVIAAATEVTVTAGQETTVTPGNPPAEPAPMSPSEQVGWGMANGPELGVLLPVVGDPEVTTYEGLAYNPQCSSDGSTLYFRVREPDSTDSQPEFVDVQSGELLPVALPDEVSNLAFSPVDDQLAYRDWEAATICTTQMNSSAVDCFGQGTYLEVGSPYWSPDGEWLVFNGRSVSLDDAYNIFAMRSDGSETVQLSYDARAYNRNPAWSADGSRVAYLSAASGTEFASDLVIVETDAGLASAQTVISQSVYSFSPPVWNPDGSLLAVRGFGEGTSGLDGGLMIVSSDGSDSRLVPGTEGWNCYSPFWSPTETGWPLWFRSAGSGEQYGLWYVPDADSSPTYFVDSYWTPCECGGSDPTMVFGFQGGSDDTPWVEINVFSLEPDFWNQGSE